MLSRELKYVMKDGPIVVTCQAAEGRSWPDVRVRFPFLSSQNHGAVRCCHGEILTLLPGQELCSSFRAPTSRLHSSASRWARLA